MLNYRELNIKEKCIVSISIAFFIIAIGLILLKDINLNNINYEISYEYINIKDMATAAVATKKDTTSIISTLTKKEQSPAEEVALPLLNNTVATLPEPKQIWYLPVENGVITNYPYYNHVALDITSSRGYNENIYPVANGVISGIYSDSAGAKIVTVLHNINGVKYTSQYVHLSAYASDLYVGKEVTINDCLGKMGTTGISTGVHLHIAVMDCALFDPSDPNCADLGSFFRYANRRNSEGFSGLGNLMQVPSSWTSR